MDGGLEPACEAAFATLYDNRSSPETQIMIASHGIGIECQEMMANAKALEGGSPEASRHPLDAARSWAACS